MFTHSFGAGHELDTMAADTNDDGKADLLAFDHAHDGRPDEVVTDENKDGHFDVDFHDTNNDGSFDTVTYGDPFNSPQLDAHTGHGEANPYAS